MRVISVVESFGVFRHREPRARHRELGTVNDWDRESDAAAGA